MNVETLENRCLLAAVPLVTGQYGDFGSLSFATVGDAVFILQQVSDDKTQLLMRSDGTSFGTRDVATPGGTPFVRQGRRVERIARSGRHDYINLADSLDEEIVAYDRKKKVARTVMNTRSISWPTSIGNQLILSRYEPEGGWNVWASGGTRATTKQLTPFHTGPNQEGQPDYLTAVGSKVFFAGNDDATRFGDQLWTTDGTVEGTTKVFDFSATTQDKGAEVFHATAVGDMFAFVAFDDGTNKGAVWVSDGTAAGTRRVSGTYPTDNVAWLTSQGGKLFFIAHVQSGGVTTSEQLWVADVHTARAKLVTVLPHEVASNGNSLGTAAMCAVGEQKLGITYYAHLDDSITYDLATGKIEALTDFTITSATRFGDLYYTKHYATGESYFRVSDGTTAGTMGADLAGDYPQATLIGLFYKEGDHLNAHYVDRGRVAGKVFNDKNHNGIQEAGENQVGGYRIFSDSNRNGKRDSGELMIDVDNGNYELVGLKVGNVALGLLDSSGHVVIAPTLVKVRLNQTRKFSFAIPV